MAEKYEIYYDWCGEEDDAYDLREDFTGTYDEVLKEIEEMKAKGCYNISVNCVSAN